MAVKIKPISKIVEDSGVKILVHGPAGAGKTVLGCTTGASTLLISAESGLLSVRNAPKYIKGVEVKTLDELEEIYEFLVEDEQENGKEKKFEWVNLDSITEIAETVLAYEKSQNKDPRKAYGELQEHMMKLLRDFRDLRGYNVYMSAKQQRISEDGGPSFFAPMMPGAKLGQQIPYIFDEVFALRVEKDEDGEDYRVLQTGRDLRFEAKDRSGELDMFEEPNLKRILQKIRGALEEEKEQEVKEDKKRKREKVEVEEPEEEGEEISEEEGEVEEPEEEEEGEEIAEEEMYWIHHESENAGVIDKGEPITVSEDDGVEFVDKESYLAYCDENGIEAEVE